MLSEPLAAKVGVTPGTGAPVASLSVIVTVGRGDAVGHDRPRPRRCSRWRRPRPHDHELQGVRDDGERLACPRAPSRSRRSCPGTDRNRRRPPSDRGLKVSERDHARSRCSAPAGSDRRASGRRRSRTRGRTGTVGARGPASTSTGTTGIAGDWSTPLREWQKKVWLKAWRRLLGLVDDGAAVGIGEVQPAEEVRRREPVGREHRPPLQFWICSTSWIGRRRGHGPNVTLAGAFWNLSVACTRRVRHCASAGDAATSTAATRSPARVSASRDRPSRRSAHCCPLLWIWISAADLRREAPGARARPVDRVHVHEVGGDRSYGR